MIEYISPLFARIEDWDWHEVVSHLQHDFCSLMKIWWFGTGRNNLPKIDQPFPQECSYITKSLLSTAYRMIFWESWFLKHSIEDFATVCSLVSHTHTHPLALAFTAWSRTSWWHLHVLWNCWSHCWHQECHCKILRHFWGQKSVIQVFAQNIAPASNWEGSSSKSTAHQFATTYSLKAFLFNNLKTINSSFFSFRRQEGNIHSAKNKEV